MSRVPGIGLDVGTGFLVAAFSDKEGNTHTKAVRDSFLEIAPKNRIISNMTRKSLLNSKISFFEVDGKFQILGNDSLEQSIEKQMVLRRPMARGVLSPKEANASHLLFALLKELLGPPVVKDEPVLYSVPASPKDAPFDVVYHESSIESILSRLGYKGHSINEAHAIAFSELDEQDFTGITISFGSGMSNISIVNLAELLSAFSLAKGGDYIDHSSAAALGFDFNNPADSEITPNFVMYVKEQGIDLKEEYRNDRVKAAIVAHYKSFIKFVVKSIVKEFNVLEKKPKFLKPIDLVVSGGTSLAIGFLDVFKEELEANGTEIPFKINSVKHASDPLSSVAKGALIALQAELE